MVTALGPVTGWRSWAAMFGGRPGVAILGAEDPLARRVALRLAGEGYRVVAITARGQERHYQDTGPVGVATVTGPASMAAALHGCQVVASLAPVHDEWAGALRRYRHAAARRQRARALNWLGEALATGLPAKLVQRSTTALYAEGGAAWVGEDWPLAPTEATRHAVLAESLAGEHAARGGGAVILRLGRPYAPAEPWARRMAALAGRGSLPLDGPQSAYVPTIHLEDAASAVVAAVTARSGTFNVADADPLTRAQVNAVFASAVGQAELSAPRGRTRAADSEAAGRSCRPDSGAFRDVAGWRPAAALSALPGLASVAWAVTGYCVPSPAPGMTGRRRNDYSETMR